MTVRRALGVLTTLGLLALSIIRAQPAAAADTCTLDTTTHVLTADVSDTSGIAVTSSTVSIGSCGPMDAAQIDVANVTATDADGTAQVVVLLPWPSGPSGPLHVNLDLAGGTDTTRHVQRRRRPRGHREGVRDRLACPLTGGAAPVASASLGR